MKRQSKHWSGLRRGRRGATLVEAMCAMILVSLTVLIFGSSFPAAARAHLRAQHIDVTQDALQQQLEYWRDAGYYSLPDPPVGFTSYTERFTPPATLPGAKGAVRMTRIDDDWNETTADTGQALVEATITWSGSGSDKGSITLTTIVTR